jgi:FixJ family two-component response regulator
MPEAVATREIFLADDDPAVREALTAAFSAGGWRVTCFADIGSLLAGARTHAPACLILDVHIPGGSGLDVLKELNAPDYPAPIFIMSGQGETRTAVDAIRSGAFDFIEKPLEGSDVFKRVTKAVAARARRDDPEAVPPGSPRFPGRELLTRREREVLAEIVSGASNKEAGRHLGISPRTIEAHRARIMEKLEARNTVDLVRIVMREGFGA